MQEAARIRIKEYIAQAVPEPLRARVHEKIRQEHSILQLQPYGVVQSDGYRPPQIRSQPPASFENNVSRLMEMGIADRTRALQLCV
jgi:hypothetical protein